MSHISKIKNVFAWIGDLWKITGVVFLLLIIGHYLMNVGIYYKRKEIFDIYKANVPAYNELPEAFWEEQTGGHKYHPEPYWHWKMNETQGQYINVNADGIRRTAKSGGGEKRYLCLVVQLCGVFGQQIGKQYPLIYNLN